jgi:hypothetical protein
MIQSNLLCDMSPQGKQSSNLDDVIFSNSGF